MVVRPEVHVYGIKDTKEGEMLRNAAVDYDGFTRWEPLADDCAEKQDIDQCPVRGC